MSFIHAVASFFTLIGSLFTPVASPQLAAALPSATAVFETSLASAITSSASSMTLTANSVRGGGSLSGYNCFTVDEGSAQAETICGTVSGTSVTSLSRGVSQATGTTTVAALQFSHRRGANVKITDFPLIQILKAQANGEDTFPNPLYYASSVTLTTGTDQLATVRYVDNKANAGAATSTETNGGLVELGTLAEQASSFDGGSAKPTVLQTKNSTSTCQVVGSYNIVASTTTGKLDKNCFDQNGIYTLASTTIGTFQSTNATTTSSLYVRGKLNFQTTSASSSVLAVDSSGNVSAITISNPQYSFASTTGTITANNAYATSTGFITIPAGVLNASSTIHVHGDIACQDGATGGKSCDIALKDSSGVAICATSLTTTSSATTNGYFDFYVTPNYSASSQSCNASVVPIDNIVNGPSGSASVTTSSVNLANAFTPAIVIRGDSSNAIGTLRHYEIDIHP